MDAKIKEYRTKHKKCKWCKYYKYNSCADCGWSIYGYSECILKDKIIELKNWPKICKWYELKEDKNEN